MCISGRNVCIPRHLGKIICLLLYIMGVKRNTKNKRMEQGGTTMTTYGNNNQYYADPAELIAETVCDRRAGLSSAGSNGKSIFATIMDNTPLAVIVLGIAVSLFGYVKFIISGGYAEAIAHFKEYGLFSFDEGVFVNSTATYVYNKFIVIPVAILLIASLIYSIRKMLQTDDNKRKKVVSVVMLIVGIVLQIALAAILEIMGTLPESLTMIGGVASTVMIIYGIVKLRKDPSTKPVVRATALYFLGIPAAVWLLENVIGFGSIVIGFLLAFGAVALIFTFMTSGDGESSGGGSSNDGGATNSREYKKMQDRMDYLNNKQAGYEHYNQRQAEGAWGYQHFSAEKNREVIRDIQKEKEYLAKDMAKMRNK